MHTGTSPYLFNCFGRSHVGLVRTRNEDAWCECLNRRAFVLADGMGGHASGDVAARYAVESCSAEMSSHRAELDRGSLAKARKHILSLFLKVNEVVYHTSCADSSLKGMGTTLLLAYFHRHGVVFGHVGDSRLYRYRSGILTQMTEDHSLVAEKLNRGELSPFDVAGCRYRNIITQAIGVHPSVSPSVSAASTKDRDLYLMCSDGLTDQLADRTIEKILSQKRPLPELTDELIHSANALGGTDNTTVILIQLTSQ